MSVEQEVVVNNNSTSTILTGRLVYDNGCLVETYVILQLFDQSLMNDMAKVARTKSDVTKEFSKTYSLAIYQGGRYPKSCKLSVYGIMDI